jgi:DNA-binding GntR family transcriptional regulator
MKRQRESLADRACRLLRGQIISNELPPGYRGLEEELALRLKMSRTPVHEAVVRLQFEGLLRVEPRRGVVVLPISPSDMREIYEVVTAVETAAVELLAARKMSPRELAPLKAAVDAMDDALAADDLPRWALADDAFHRVMLELCGNVRLAAIGIAQQDQVRRARQVTLKRRPTPKASNEAHRQTYEAILAGDAERARELHRRQRERASAQLTKLLQDFSQSSL